MGGTMYICMCRICIQKYNYCMWAHEHAVSHLCHVPPIAVWVDRPPFGSHSYSLLCNTSRVVEPNNDDNRSQFTPKFIVSLDHMYTYRNCRHDDPKTQSNVNCSFFVSSSVILQFYRAIFFLFTLLYFERECLQGLPRAPAHWQNDSCLLGYDAVYTGI